MKYKTTAKELRNYGYNVVSCGYCDLQHLLNYRSPNAYTSGIYGWNFDVYELEHITITTGYRGTVGVRIPYEIIEKYEKMAEKILYTSGTKNKKIKLDKLIAKFEKEICKIIFDFDIV